MWIYLAKSFTLIRLKRKDKKDKVVSALNELSTMT
jgi:hypothetical protein